MIAALVFWAAVKTATSCITCHGTEGKVKHFAADVHSQVGLSCQDCHGGNPDPKVAEDIGAAMDPNFKANPFRGAPKRAEIPEFCGRCHSSAEYMKRFNPGMRVDQVTEYWTSKHGEQLKKGDPNVATCIDCHSVHGIKRKSQPDSPVYPTHVAETCSRCHSDAKRMAPYHIPTDQYARWKVSVHANAMFVKNDLSAPTCNDCHGNHGATPPGVDRVVFVCGNCHLREAELFRKSAKSHDWEQHNTFLATGAKCADCHDDQRAKLAVNKFNECVTCHENHAIVRPSVAMLGPLPDTPCVFCHEPGSKEPAAAHHEEVKNELLARALQLHLTGPQRFDWLVDQAQKLPFHTHPEFVRLFEKFRIGKTQYNFDQVNVSVRRCIDCHPANDPNGRVTALDYLNTMRTVTSTTARSQRILLAAANGGVEVRKARPELDAAVDNQIELETLVHTFTPPAKLFHDKANEGIGHARAALSAANDALAELAYRRRGLEIALAVIVLALIALALKIRTL
ncbi:MAG TPA: hypothetical protein VI391_08840 [Thermoanaerobaculia bacterium]